MVDLERSYFSWLTSHVLDRVGRSQFKKLTESLYNRDFVWLHPRDENRAIDGLDLRERFFWENDISYDLLETFLADKPCSVLEMLVALSIRCEEHIMADSSQGDRTGLWFWIMVTNLGLGGMQDLTYSPEYVDACVDRLLYRTYDYDGRGGLFYLQNPPEDLRSVEVWYQMNWYLNEFE